MKKQIYFNAKLQSWLWLCFACLLIAPAPLYSQGGIWGAEMRKNTGGNAVGVSIRVYRTGAPVPEIKVKWGDGTEEWLASAWSREVSDEMLMEVYTGQHTYQEPGMYAISFKDSFLVGGVANISGSGNQVLEFRDSVHIDPSEQILDGNSPYTIGYMYEPGFFEFDEGLLTVRRNFQQQIDFPFNAFEELETELVPFPASGYSDPPGAEGIEVYAPDIGRARLVWDRPIEPGRYALCMKVNEYRDFEGARYFMSTNHFAFIVDVDEDMIVSTSSPSAEALPLQLFPNPTSSTLYLKAKLPSPAPALLTVQDAMGRELLRQPLPAARWQHELDVSAWPAGVYFLRLRQGEVEVVERFVKGE